MPYNEIGSMGTIIDYYSLRSGIGYSLFVTPLHTPITISAELSRNYFACTYIYNIMEKNIYILLEQATSVSYIIYGTVSYSDYVVLFVTYLFPLRGRDHSRPLWKGKQHLGLGLAPSRCRCTTRQCCC